MVPRTGTTWRRAAVLALACGCADSAAPAADDASLPDSGTLDAAPDRAADAPSDAPVDDAGSCVDGLRNGKETDVDCGGNCPVCADGKDCLADTDCQVGTCFAGKCAPRAWTVQSNGSNVAIPGNQTWVPAAGLTVSPTLLAPSLVSLRWTGTLRFGGGGNGLCHVGQHFVVDGVPTGQVTWGDAIMVQNGATRWQESFNDAIALPLSAGIHTVSVEMLNAQGFGTCNLDGDAAAAYDRSRLAVAAYNPQGAWYAESNGETGYLGGSSPWTNIPGVSVSFTLAGTNHVQASLAGTQLSQGSGSAHCSYRFVVDGTPLGHPTYGQTIAVGDVASGWWGPVALAYGGDLQGGAHVISAQVSNSSGGGGTCNAGQGNNPYARFHLLVTASPPGSPATSVDSSGGPNVLGSTSAWTTIAGLTASFNVPAKRHLQLELAATQRTVSGSGHCAWRFVIDGTPLGDPDNGLGINVGDAATWWTSTPLLWGQTFDTGSHTVVAQVRNSSNSGDCGANGDAQPYGGARLLVHAP